MNNEVFLVYVVFYGEIVEDNDDLGTMMEIWWSTGSVNPQPVELFAELADLEPVENVSPINSDQNVEDFSDPDVDEVPDDIDDEGPEEVEDVHGPSFCNPSHGIILRNELGGNMLNVDPDAAHASEFLEYADIVPAHSMKLSIDYKWTQQWKIRKLEGRHTCTVARMSQDHRKLDAKSICNCIMPLVKDSRIIPGLVAAIRQSEVLWRSVYCIRHIAVNFHNEYKKKDWRKRIVNMGYELEPHRFRHKLARLETDMAGCKPSLTQWLSSMEPLATLMPKMGLKQAKQLEAGHLYIEKIRDAMKDNTQRARLMNVELYSRNLETFRVTEYISRRSGIPPRSYGVDLRNRRCECGMFQALRYPYAHVVAACATYSLNVEQYIDDVYKLERTLRIWGNEFPVLRDISTWEVQSPAFEMLPDRLLRRRVKGRPTITRIRNDMDVREQVDPKRCTICRTVGHNRSKCPHGNVYTSQSSRSERN
ncbi:hypothetical protein GOBAR_AA27973 [Gossypium barbadense]|uniref:Zinc finger PMZ-type domain-containing protein n=1 Tax=Gossypium barbadense TaxID=3634 RepID=A0A2P5WNL2_GOSBA|nr:hypothetical protein GOBAR_AA27973 [Gossypium barbadense]